MIRKRPIHGRNYCICQQPSSIIRRCGIFRKTVDITLAVALLHKKRREIIRNDQVHDSTIKYQRETNKKENSNPNTTNFLQQDISCMKGHGSSRWLVIKAHRRAIQFPLDQRIAPLFIRCYN